VQGIMTQTITRKMRDDHHHCDEIFVAAEELVAGGDWQQGAARFEDFAGAIEHHFSMEEEVLFPAFEQQTGMTTGPTTMMRSEHVQMRELLAGMRLAAQRQDQDGYLGLSETMLVVMQQHNAKEEQMLYPMADQALSDSRDDVIGRMTAL